MVQDTSLSRKIFVGFNYTFLALMAFLCLFPIVHILAISFSSNQAVVKGLVTLWPVEFTTASYKYALSKDAFTTSIGVSLKRILFGTLVQMLMIVHIAYPLSKEATQFKMRTFYVWFFFITMLVGGGLIPTYMVIRNTGLIDTIWALVIPNAVPVFSIVLLLNFFRAIPKELEEAAFMDGAGHFRLLWKIYIPLSTPALATLFLFSIVFHWNSWFDGLIYMNDISRYPLQTYLQTIVTGFEMDVVSEEDADLLKELSNRTFRSAQVFLGALPVLLVYPFLQRYFMKGIVLGSVKE